MEKAKNEVEETEQEILTPAEPMDSGTLAILQKSEINEQISVAKRYPRRISDVVNMATQLVTASAEIADEMIYALPRAGKTIEGPSVRFSEVLAYSWTNCRCGARVISEDPEFVVAQGSFFDMQVNVHVGYEVKRRITDKNGKRFNADMISVTSNAACSIALRNAILRGIPKAIWKKVYDQARSAIAGDIKTLDSRRVAAMKQFQLMGVKPEQIFTLLDIKGLDDISLDNLVTLRGLWNSLREGEITVERAFASKDTEDKNLAAKSAKNLEEIKQKYAQEQPEAPSPERIAQLRAEADRQQKALEEKYGAGQPPTTPPVDTPQAAPAAAAVEPAAPPDQQSVEVGPPPVIADGPEGGSGESSSAPEPPPGAVFKPHQQQADSPEQHGIPNIFDEPPKGKPKTKR